MEWTQVDSNAYTAETTKVGRFFVTVCLDDEGPFWEAYYWDIEELDDDGVRRGCINGWSRSVAVARKESVAAAANRLTIEAEDGKVIT